MCTVITMIMHDLLQPNVLAFVVLCCFVWLSIFFSFFNFFSCYVMEYNVIPLLPIFYHFYIIYIIMIISCHNVAYDCFN